MKMDTAISVKNVSKKYKLYNSPKDRLKEIFHPRRKKYHQDFWALQGISFDVPKSTAMGIIGQNGCGKSTLLQIICGILQASSGHVKTNGRISALLELGTGFNPDFTGRQNVYMNGAVKGFTKKDMDQRFDDIESFADIGDFIEQPVKMYSSGMYVRLAFACAVNVDPDILIIDEVLAVGDFKFKQKCSEKINELRKKTTVILVSHSTRDILMLCSRAIVLDNSRIAFQGDSEQAVDFYLDLLNADEAKKNEEKRARKEGRQQIKSTSSVYGQIYHNKEKISDVRYQWVGESGKPVRSIEHCDTIILEFSFKLLKPVDNLVIGVPIWDGNGNLVTASNTDAKRIEINVNKHGTVRGKLILENLIFNPGKYNSIFAVVDSKEYLYRDFIDEFRVKDIPFYFGIVTLKHIWHFEP